MPRQQFKYFQHFFGLTVEKQHFQRALLSICVPCLNEEAALPIFLNTTLPIVEKLKQEGKIAQFEFVFVDDGSDDSTLSILEKWAKEHSFVRFCSFSRNFGKESAILAALQKAQGEFVALMDVDLQDPPSLLPAMLDAVLSHQFDMSATRRVSRQNEPAIRSFFARAFYKIINFFSDIQIVDGARDFRLMHRNVVNAILNLQERNRFSKGIFSWVGFRTQYFEFENVMRSAGNTKWNFFKLAAYALDGITAFSTKPLAFAGYLGIASILFSFLFIAFVILRKLFWGDEVQGWASLTCLISFIGGIQLLCLGIIGQYLAKTYVETKSRPMYFIQKESP